MFLSSISIKRPIMISMFLIAFVVFGALAYFGLTLNMMPDVDIPVVTVQTVYPGAGPNEIEIQVTKKIEDAVSTVSKIDLIRSFSMEGVSMVIIQFDLDKDVDIGNQEVKDKVNAIINTLPRDAELPVVVKFDIGAKSLAVINCNLSIRFNSFLSIWGFDFSSCNSLSLKNSKSSMQLSRAY